MHFKSIFIQTFVCFNVFLSGQLQAQNVFQISFSNGIFMSGHDIRLSNGNYYIGGTAKQATASDFLLIKTNNLGDTLWTRKFHAGSPVECKQILVGDGFIYMLGNCNPGTVTSKGFIAKVGENGLVAWTKQYGGSGTYEFNSFELANDSLIVVSGNVTGEGAGGKDVLITMFDTSGLVKSSKAYGTPGNETGNSVTGNPEEGYFITGNTDSNDPQGDIFILNLAADWTPVWCKSYNIIYGTNYSGQHAYDLIRIANNLLTVSGDTKVFEFPPSDEVWNPLIMKCDLSGNVIYAKDYSLNSGGGPASRVIETSDSHFVLTGYMRSTLGTLIKTTELGEPDWSRVYGTSNIGSGGLNNVSHSLLQDGTSFLLTGYIETTYDTSLFFVKTNNLGESGCFFTDTPYCNPGTDNPTINSLNFTTTPVNTTISDLPLTVSPANASMYVYCDIPTGVKGTEDNISVFPNPVSDYIHLQGVSQQATYQLINSLGDILETGWSHVIDVRYYQPGIYFLRINDKGICHSYKIIHFLNCN